MKRAIVHAPNTYYGIERNQLTGDLVYQFPSPSARDAWVRHKALSRRRGLSSDPLVRAFLAGGDYRYHRDQHGTRPLPAKGH